jgi:hypothetical protein
VCTATYLALEAIDNENGHACKVEGVESGPNRVEAVHCARVVILVMAPDELFGQSFESEDSGFIFI